MADANTVTPDTEINIKVSYAGATRKVKLPLCDLGPDVFPVKLRALLDIPPFEDVVFERFSDSAGFFVLLDSNNPPVYKQLYRAAKAKLKLRIRATVVKSATAPSPPAPSAVESAAKALPQPAPATPTVNAQSQVRPQGDGVAPVSSIPRIVAGPQVDSALSASSKPSVDGSDRKQADANSVLIPGLSDGSTKSHEHAEAVTEYEKCLADLCRMNEAHLRRHSIPPPPPVQLSGSSYSVYCNACDAPIADEHYHCGICDGGDFDLCLDCVGSGQVCDGDGHWLIKRNIQDGKILNSTTKTLAPRVQSRLGKPSDVPEPPEAGAGLGPNYLPYGGTRTCNSCVQDLPESKFVTCTVCEDFDLCIPCLVNMRHGHNPHHPFEVAVSRIKLEPEVAALCAPGRNVAHAALCDGCDKSIRGIRHKCLDCPDWDYCSTCFASASFIHPGHRFCPVFGNLAPRRTQKERHFGILCDGPLCTGKSGQKSITGDRYKCTVCHDTDFCANCEASPANQHNKTHPLIKFRTPIRNVTVSTYGETKEGEQMAVMGDHHNSIKSTPCPSTQAKEEPSAPEKVVIKPSPKVSEDLNAHFLSDAVPDGMEISPGSVFHQVWTLRNPGPAVWPAGCSVKFIGGDNMRNVDIRHPISVADLEKSVESTIIPRELEVGGVWSFRVTLKTPSRPGRFISYWRLTAPNGVKFGHKLWCDIDVMDHLRDLNDYQLQLMLLEQQNKRRLIQARKQALTETLETSPQEHQLKVQRNESHDSTREQDTQSMPEPSASVKAEGGEKLIDLLESKETDEQAKSCSEHAAGKEVSRAESSEHDVKAETTPTLENTDKEVKTESPVSESTMIFPTLDKESPVPSNGAAKTETLVSEQDDLASEVASLTLEDDESEDDFLTDEEYDILDASDEEAPGSAEKGASK